MRSGREIDVTKPITLAAYGEYTKKAGFYRLEGGELKELLFDDAVFSNPVRAEKADRFLFTRQTFVDFPDLRVSGASLADSRRISDANPQQAEYMWGHRVLFNYKNRDGVRLQGILALPDDYKPGEKRPMIVSFYEKNSQNMHRYTPPSFVTGMGSLPVEALSHGYLTMLADVYFHTGSSHSDMLDAVEAATKKVIELGYADPKKIAVHGHSYGGEGAAFIGTRSKMFAAVGHGRRRDRPVLRLQPGAGVVVPGTGRKWRQRERLLPVRPGTLGEVAVGRSGAVSLRDRPGQRA